MSSTSERWKNKNSDLKSLLLKNVADVGDSLLRDAWGVCHHASSRASELKKLRDHDRPWSNGT